jgi:hypothetical protein
VTQPPLGLTGLAGLVHEETCEVHEGYWATHAEFADGKRLRLMQALDPARRWARGSGSPRWRQRTIDGHRFDWRQVEGECIVCQRQGDLLFWVHGQGMPVEDVLAIARAVSTSV